MAKPIYNEQTGNYLFIAVDIFEGGLVGAMWAKDETTADNYFYRHWPPLVADISDLKVELADETECPLEDIIFEFPELADGEGSATHDLYDPDAAWDARYDNALRDFNESTNTSKGMTESYRRTVSRGAALNDNPLFVDFD